jgi:hypothetical protein
MKNPIYKESTLLFFVGYITLQKSSIVLMLSFAATPLGSL